jgi:hypothetical protein
MSIYFYIGSKIFEKSMAPPLVKISINKDSTLTIKFDFLFVEHNFDFRFRLPVFRKSPYFRFEVGNGGQRVDGAGAAGGLYTPSGFHANRSAGLGGVGG